MATKRRPGWRERGQGVVEFAVIFPIFAVMLFAVIDGGLVMGRYNSLQNASAEGARLAAVGSDASAVAGNVAAHSHGLMDGYTLDTPNSGACGTAGKRICVEWLAGPDGAARCDVGSEVRVTVRYPDESITPLIDVGAWTIETQSVARLERPADGC